MNEPHIDVVDSDHCLAYWENVFIQIWRRNPAEEKTRGMRASGRRFLSSTAGSVGVVVVVEGKCPLPDSAARANTIGFLDDLRDRGSAIVLVFEGEGFLAAASRAAMVGLMTAARFPMPYKVARTVSEGEAFIQPTLPQRSSGRGQLVSAVEMARGRIQQRIAS